MSRGGQSGKTDSRHIGHLQLDDNHDHETLNNFCSETETRLEGTDPKAVLFLWREAYMYVWYMLYEVHTPETSLELSYRRQCSFLASLLRRREMTLLSTHQLV